MLNEARIINKIDSSKSRPDHSLLTWSVILDRYTKENKTEIPKDCRTTYTSYDRSSIPENFLHICQEDIENLIFKLESECITQESVTTHVVYIMILWI